MKTTFQTQVLCIARARFIATLLCARGHTTNIDPASGSVEPHTEPLTKASDALSSDDNRNGGGARLTSHGELLNNPDDTRNTARHGKTYSF